MEKTLRNLRIERGLSHEELVAQLAEVTGIDRRPAASMSWEFRGIANGDVRDALAKIYGISSEEIKRASNQSRSTPGPLLPRGRKKTLQKEIMPAII